MADTHKIDSLIPSSKVTISRPSVRIATRQFQFGDLHTKRADSLVLQPGCTGWYYQHPGMRRRIKFLAYFRPSFVAIGRIWWMSPMSSFSSSKKQTNKTKEQLTVATGVQGFDSFLQFGQTVSVHVQNLIQMKPKKKKIRIRKIWIKAEQTSHLNKSPGSNSKFFSPFF